MKLNILKVFSLFIYSTVMVASGNLSAELKIDFVAPTGTDSKTATGTETTEPLKPVSDIIKFHNGDKFHGKMISLDTKGLVWSSEEATAKIAFRTENIKDILLGTQKSYAKNVNTQILLTNGDMIAGKLVKLSAKELILDTGYAGELKIDRFMIEAIYPGIGGESNEYKGPNSIKEWTIDNNSGDNSSKVTVKEGVLSLTGYYVCVGQDMKLPDLSKVEFEIESVGNSQIQIYGSKIKKNPRNGYVLYISSGYIYLQRYEDGSSNNMGNFRSKELQRGKGKITILSNKKEKKIILLINGKMVKQWSDTEWAGIGGCVSFLNQSNQTVKFRHIVIGRWNGKIPGSKNSEVSEGKDSIAFVNDDVVSGELKSIVDGKVVFKTEYAAMNIPLKRVKEIVTASSSRHRARRRAKDMRCFFSNGDSITIDLKHIKKGIIEGTNGNFGVAKMKLNAFSKLQFNIYDEEEEDE